MIMRHLQDTDIAGARVLIRSDLNVPLGPDGQVQDDARLRAALPAIRYTLGQGAQVLVVSHLGRPKSGPEPTLSLRPVARRLSELLGREVPLVEDWHHQVPDSLGDMRPGDIALLENVRFHPGEMTDDQAFAGHMAALCDVYVNDAFGVAHRKQASCHAVVAHASVACAGPLLASEITTLHRALENPARPLVAIVGGSKISGKLQALRHLCERVDVLIVGGGIANTFLMAAGHRIGKSLVEPDLLEMAKVIAHYCSDNSVELLLPTDVTVASEFSADAKARVCAVDAVADNEMILDIGPETAVRIAKVIEKARTVLWNGPLGAFEMAPFAGGTKSLAYAVVGSGAFSIAGGGDTLAALALTSTVEDITYVSTGGGAFLELLEGKKLPAIAALEKKGTVTPGAHASA